MAKRKSIPPSVTRDLKNKIKASSQFRAAAQKAGEEAFLSVKSDFFNEFEEHPITQEIEAGPTATNLSGTLNGYGNLFSFIGFNSGDNPVGQLRSILKSMMRMSKVKVRKGAETKVFFEVSVPDIKVITAGTPMPWESGRSWVRGVERGISGFGYYMSTQEKRFSRSGAGIQADSRLRAGAYVPRKYMSQMLRNLNRNLRKLVR